MSRILDEKLKIGSFVILGFILFLLVGFSVLQYFYESYAFESFLRISKNFDESHDINYTVRNITQIYNDTLIRFLIFPIFFITGISVFANYIFYKRVNYLEAELKEIKEKIDA